MRVLLNALFPLLLLMIPALPVCAQWSSQSPVPTFLDVRGVAAPATGHVFIATSDDSFDDGGALFESNDGGATWLQRDVPFSLGSPLNGIFFLDSQNGWTFGNDNYRTTDGGTSWSELPILGSTYFMEFYTPNFGLAAGNFGHFVSYDGGLSWQVSPHDIVAFDFIDDLTGLGAADTGLYRTTDGGTSFSPVLVGTSSAATFLSATEAVGIVDGSFVRSTDGGETWAAGTDTGGRNRLVAVSDNVALAWGRTGSFPDYDDRVFRSEDGGQTWTDLGEVVEVGVFAFTVVSGQTVVAADLEGNLFQSADAGLNWTQTYTSPGPRPGFLSSAAPSFADTQTGYFGYGPGFVIRTTDGGASWVQISSGSGTSLSDIDRFANGDMIAVGETGTLLTSTGTTPWVLHEVFTSLDLTAIDILNSTDVVVVDEAGRIYKSADRGESWVAANAVPPISGAEDLDFTSLLDGWVTGLGGGAGAVFHTSDGGDSWSPVPDFTGAYVAVDFEGPHGWAANVSGRFYRTIDEGGTWIQEQLPGSPLSITDMDFFDVSAGYAVGRWGYAARSDDGGMTWQTLPTPNSTDLLTGIYLLGPNELWISTSDDVAYYTATGGQNWAALPVNSSGFGSFAAIAARADGDAWMVGWQGRIEHFTGPPPPPLNRPPEASFEFVTAGFTVDFTDTSTDPDGIIVSWLWDFGDGTGSIEQSPSHTYEIENTYIVRLTVTDDDGDTGATVRFIVAQPGPGGVFGDFTEVTPPDPLFVTPQNEDFWVSSTAAADYDGDNDLDMAVLGFYVVYNQSVVERLVLIRNEGPAGPQEWEFSYIDVPLGTLSSGSSDLAWGDVDNDGDEDLVVGTDGQTVIYRNDEGVLSATDTVLPGYYEDNFQADFDLQSISWADFDNDGDLDLLLPSVFDTEIFEYRTALLRNDGPNGSGGWIFNEVVAGLATTIHAQSTWSDFDGDQDLDLLLVNLSPLTDDGFIRRYRNDGEGTFTGEDILGGLTIEHGEAQWGDYDADGDLDVLVAGHIKEIDGTFNRVLRIYRNDAETYVPFEVIDCIPCEGWFELTAATWADYDSDGDMDILLTGSYNSGSQIEGRAKIYKNDGGVFTDSGNDLPAPRAGGSRGGSFTWLDIDGENDLDYFIAGEYFVPGGNGLIEAQMHLYRNDVQGQNAAPSMPTDLAAVVEGPMSGFGSGATVQLSWSPASDDLTPVAALTYDLSLYRNGVPLANPRFRPEPGNVSSGTNWALTDLVDGEYIWTLRAVDSAYSGGTVAEAGFTIGSTTDVDPSGDLPNLFALESHPNPFRTSTSFRIALPSSAEVELDVYDLRGRRVSQLVHETRSAGVHEIEWDAGDLSAGVYFARLRVEDFTTTQRVLLVK